MKPENILIDENGYPRLADFGLSIDQNAAETNESIPKNYFVGTLDYTAPEIFRKQAYKEASDLWSFGCVLYEMVIGLPPFYSQEPRRTVQKIIQKSPDFSMFGSEMKDLKDLISKLLIKDPQRRLAAFADIKAHPWLVKNINLEDVSGGKVEAPFVPQEIEVSAEKLFQQKEKMDKDLESIIPLFL